MAIDANFSASLMTHVMIVPFLDGVTCLDRVRALLRQPLQIKATLRKKQWNLTMWLGFSLSLCRKVEPEREVLPIAHCTSVIARITELRRGKIQWKAGWGSNVPIMGCRLHLAVSVSLVYLSAELWAPAPGKGAGSAAVFTNAHDKN